MSNKQERPVFEDSLDAAAYYTGVYLKRATLEWMNLGKKLFKSLEPKPQTMYGMMHCTTLGWRLGRALKFNKRFTTQVQLAEATKISPVVLSKYFNWTDDKGLPKLENLIALAKALDCSLEWLCGFRYEPVPLELPFLDEVGAKILLPKSTTNLMLQDESMLLKVTGESKSGKSAMLGNLWKTAIRQGIRTSLYLTTMSIEDWYRHWGEIGDLSVKYIDYGEETGRLFISDKFLNQSVSFVELKNQMYFDLIDGRVDPDIIFLEGNWQMDDAYSAMELSDVRSLGRRLGVTRRSVVYETMYPSCNDMGKVDSITTVCKDEVYSASLRMYVEREHMFEVESGSDSESDIESDFEGYDVEFEDFEAEDEDFAVDFQESVSKIRALGTYESKDYTLESLKIFPDLPRDYLFSKNLRLRYNDQDFEVAPGGLIVVYGDYGSGKSSALAKIQVEAMNQALRTAFYYKDRDLEFLLQRLEPQRPLEEFDNVISRKEKFDALNKFYPNLHFVASKEKSMVGLKRRSYMDGVKGVVLDDTLNEFRDIHDILERDMHSKGVEPDVLILEGIWEGECKYDKLINLKHVQRLGRQGRDSRTVAIEVRKRPSEETLKWWGSQDVLLLNTIRTPESLKIEVKAELIKAMPK